MPYLYIHSKHSVRTEKDAAGKLKKVFIDGTWHKPHTSDLNNADPAAVEKYVEKYSIDKKREYYSEFLKNPFKNLIVLSGAGTSIGIGNGGKVGLSMHDLWEAAKKHLTEEVFRKLCEYLKLNPEDPNLETLISTIDGHINYASNDKSAVDLIDCREKLLALIKDKCNLQAPEDLNDFPHIGFLSKITQRKVTLPRVKIFTINYDLLFEKAATEINAVVLDGFSFTTPRSFSGRLFDYDIVQREKSRLKDEDNFISRLFHLYKLHGSLNWAKVENRIQIEQNAMNPLMIYPRESKYENSYEQPYFEMMARFHQNLKMDSTLLLCIGYSFNDKHINIAIKEALYQNPGFQLAIINPGFDDNNNNFKEFVERAKTSESVIMIDETFEDFAAHFPEIQTYSYNLDFPDTSRSYIDENESI